MPINHVISIRDQRISVCDARVVVGSRNFDTFSVDADAEGPVYRAKVDTAYSPDTVLGNWELVE